MGNAANEKSAVLICAICDKRYPPGFAQCPVDEGCLIETYESDPLIGRLFADKYEIL
jgi:hypothetical protein